MARRIEHRPGELTAALFERERSQISLSLEKNVRQILNVLAIWYPDEYDMIRILAQGEKSTFVGFATDSSVFTQHVEGYGLVRDARGDPKILIGLIREYLTRVPRKARDQEADPTDSEAVLVEVSRRRNAVEIGLREVMKAGLWVQYGRSAAHQVLQALSEDRRVPLAQFSYKDMWQQMYFSDLISILDKHWGVFAKAFVVPKTDMLIWLGHINKCRSDAHAKELNSDDLAFLRVCFRRVEELLETVVS